MPGAQSTPTAPPPAAAPGESATTLREEVQRLRALEAARQKHAERMNRLEAVITDLASALVVDTVASVIVDHAVAAVGALAAGVWLVDERREHATLVHAHGYPGDALDELATLDLARSSPLTDAIQSGASRFLLDSERVPQLCPPRAGALACLPLGARAPLGVLAFTFDSQHVFDDDERRFLELLSAHCAHAMQRARTYEAERQARAGTALLYALLDGVAAAETLEQVWEPALTGITQALGCVRAAVLLYDEDDVVRFKAWRGLSAGYRSTVEGHSPWNRDSRSPRPVLVPDVFKDTSLKAFHQAFHSEDIRSLAFVPLVHARKLIGRLMVYDSAPRQFDRRALLLAQTIAAQVAQAVARRLSEAEVKRAYAEAEVANRMKDEFLAVVSHELRTPLAAIAGWAALLLGEKHNDPAALAKGLAVIDRNARAQARIIEDILDVSRIITGKLVLDPQPISLPGIIAEALESVRASAVAKDIDIVSETSDRALTVAGDPARLRQIAWNLLSNAVKFTPPGGQVRVRVVREPGAVVLEVRDTGSGIDADFLPYVFDRFRQADASATRSQRGLGLGLAIVRHLVELHGGHVRAESPGLGRGATFVVTFPVRALVAPDAEQRLAGAAPEPHDLSGLRVLLVEDEADARELLREVLTSSGAAVHAAANAAEALGVLERFAPDVVVSDIGMPGQDGFALVRRIRALDPPFGALPAIALTAYTRPTDARGALSAGFQQFIVKPADPAVLTAAVLEAARLSHDARPTRPRLS